MASEYLKKKYQDVKPDEPRVLTKKEKAANWWYYHKVHVLVGVVVLLIVGFFVRDIRANVSPDYQIAYMGKTPLTEEAAAAVTAVIEPLCEDVNGDGTVKLVCSGYGDNLQDPSAYAENMKLTAELAGGVHQIFLLEDPVAFQERYGVLMQKDGTAFSEGDDPKDCLCYPVGACPALQGMWEYGEVYLARRCSREEDEAAVSALWDRLTADAGHAAEFEE